MTAPRPQGGAPRAYAFPAVHRARLANGLGVAVARLPRLPLVTVLALVDAGAVCDSAGAEGTASLTALGLAEGTTGRDGVALTEQFELLGTGLGVGCDWDSAMVYVTVTPARLERVLALLAEALTAPAFGERDVERLKTERLAELLQQQAEPRGLANDKFAEFLFAERSRYSVPAGGSANSVRRLSADRLRGFHRERYVPGATTLIFAGDVEAEHAIALTERVLDTWRGVPPATCAVDDRTNGRARRVCVVNRPDAPQTELRVGHRGVRRRHPDYFPILVMNALLGGLFSSRINLNLRERNGFTYGARSAFDWRRHEGPFVVSTAVRTDVTDAAAREILREIATLRTEPVGDDELSLATAYLDGVFPIRYETTQAVAEAIATAEVYGLGDDYYGCYRERVRAVTAADVHRAAEAHLHPEELLVLAVGDAGANLLVDGGSSVNSHMF